MCVYTCVYITYAAKDVRVVEEYSEFAKHRWQLSHNQKDYVCCDCESTYIVDSETFTESQLLKDARDMAQLQQELNQ